MTILGHSSSDVTLDLYVDSTEEDTKNAINAFTDFAKFEF